MMELEGGRREKRKEGRKMENGRDEMSKSGRGGGGEGKGEGGREDKERTTFTGEVWPALPPCLDVLTVPWLARKGRACKGECKQRQLHLRASACKSGCKKG